MSDEALVRELRKQIEEAAAEIERLREALRTAEAWLVDPSGPDEARCALGTIRAALGGSDE